MLLSFKMVSHIASKHYNSIISKAIFTTLYNTESMKGQDDVFFSWNGRRRQSKSDWQPIK